MTNKQSRRHALSPLNQVIRELGARGFEVKFYGWSYHDGDVYQPKEQIFSVVSPSQGLSLRSQNGFALRSESGLRELLDGKDKYFD